MTEARRCAIYTRKSSDEGLDQAFNSLHAQHEACAAYITSQQGEGWRALATHYDDGGFSGGNLDRPALQQLLADVDAGLVHVIVVYKVDRLTRSLTDFAKIVERLDQRGVSFVSITQQFNTTSSMGRLTLNVLLSFAQFEREVTGERIRDKIAASKRKGMWMGGHPPLGYDVEERTLVANPGEAKLVRTIFQTYLKLRSVQKLRRWLDSQNLVSKRRTSKSGRTFGGMSFSRGALYTLLQNRIYLAEIVHKDQTYPGTHPATIDQGTWAKTQALLAQNRTDQSSRRLAKEPSLLAGMLFDANGARMTPTHATKLGKRYRYYVSRTLTEGSAKGTSAIRVPAHDIERLVADALPQFLNEEARLGAILKPLWQSATPIRRLVHQATMIAQDWSGQSVVERIAILKQLELRVVLDDRDLSITIPHRPLVTCLLARDKQTELLTTAMMKKLDGQKKSIVVPARLKRCGSEMRLVIPNADPTDRAPRPNKALIKAVARAHVWREQLLSGRASTTRDIARMAGVSPRYVREIFNLIYLSPRLVDIVLAGKQPSDLTLDQLVADLPIAWDAQEQRFGLYAA